MIKVQCDRCGVQEKSLSVVVPAPKNGVPSHQLPVPDEWRRILFPMPDGSAWHRDFCGECVASLWEWCGEEGNVK